MMSSHGRSTPVTSGSSAAGGRMTPTKTTNTPVTASSGRHTTEALTEAMRMSALDGDEDSLAVVETEVSCKVRGKAPSMVDVEALTPLRAIGVGGQGGVWLAVDPKSGIRCAVKQVRKGRLAKLPHKAATRALTEREALIDVCGHPFITTCYATFQNDSSLFFALELAPHGDLFGVLEQFPYGLPEVNARFYCICVALALKWVHAQGWVYRDVKCAPPCRHPPGP
jgi:hypothetical protein